MQSLKYTDERDKVYGLTGMAVTIVALNGSDCIGGIDLDAGAAERFILLSSVEFGSNSHVSAKSVWAQSVKDLRLTVSAALGNLACRRYVLANSFMRSSEVAALRDAMREDAAQWCQLDNDEADRVFDHCRNYVEHLFMHEGIRGVAHKFASRLAEARSYSGNETVEILSSLGLR